MNVAVSGISGFLGSHLVRELSRNYNVIGITSSDQNAVFSLCSQVVKHENLLDVKLNIDVLIMAHAAVVSGNKTDSNGNLYSVNVEVTESLIKALQPKKVIYCSSVSVYGNQKNVNQDSEPQPISAYAISKLWGEQVVKANCKDYSIVRFSSLYGTHMKENTILPIFVKSALAQNKINVYGNGLRKQNYLHVSDAIGFIIASINTSNTGVFLCVDSTNVTNIELAKTLMKVSGAEICFVGKDETPSISYSLIKDGNAIHYTPKTSLEEGIKKYIDWRKKEF